MRHGWWLGLRTRAAVISYSARFRENLTSGACPGTNENNLKKRIEVESEKPN